MEPNRSFIEQLKRYDSDLSARWDGEMRRWVIYFKDKQVYIVKNDDGSFRPLDSRTMDFVQKSDTRRYGDVRGYLNFLRSQDDEWKARNKKAWHDLMEDIHKDAKPILKGRHTVDMRPATIEHKETFTVTDRRIKINDQDDKQPDTEEKHEDS